MTTSTSLSSSTYLPFLEIERTELLFSAFLFFTIIMTAITFLTFVRNKDNILLKMILFILLSGFINLLLKNFNIDFTEIDSLILEQMPITLALWIAFLLWNLKSNRILKTIGYTFIFIFFNYSLMHFSTLGVYSGLSKENQEIIESNDLFHGNAVMSLCQDNGKEIVYKWMVIPFERDCHHTIFLEEKEALTNEKQIYIDSLKSPAYPTVVSGLYNYRHKISKISKQQITEFYLLQYRTLKRHSDYYDEFESLRKNNAFKKFYKNMEPSVQILEKNPEKTIFDIKENELEETQTVFLDRFKWFYETFNNNSTNKNLENNKILIKQLIKIGNKINDCYYNEDCRYMKNIDLNKSLKFAPEFFLINRKHAEIVQYF